MLIDRFQIGFNDFWKMIDREKRIRGILNSPENVFSPTSNFHKKPYSPPFLVKYGIIRFHSVFRRSENVRI